MQYSSIYYYLIIIIILFIYTQGLRNTVSEVEYYTVMFDPAFIPFPVLTPNTSCHSDECNFNFTLTLVPHPFTNDNATFSLLLTATSAVGESSPALCSLYPIGKDQSQIIKIAILQCVRVISTLPELSELHLFRCFYNGSIS